MSRLIHTCKDSIESDLIIHYSESFMSWTVKIESKATEQAVKMGEAERVGEFQCSHEIITNYCPSCGQELESI